MFGLRPITSPKRRRRGVTSLAYLELKNLHVSLEDGTGIVHIAPGCGSEDFALGKELGLPVIAPIDESGIFIAEEKAGQGQEPSR